MSSEMKSVQELLAEKKAKRRVIYQRPRLTKSQLAAYYGLPDMSTVGSDNENDDKGIEVEEEPRPPEARIPAPETPKRRSRDLAETSKASITFSKSVLDVFDKTKSIEEESDEDEPYDEQMDGETSKGYSHGLNQSSKASITFSLSVLAVFDKTKTTEEEGSEEDEQTDVENSKESSQGPGESSKASITFSKSVLAVFDKTKTTAEEENEQIEVETAEASKVPNVHVSSPICPKILNPPSVPKPKVHVTPRKSITVQKKVKDHSFNAAKLPVLNSSLFDGLPKVQHLFQNRHPDSLPNDDIPTVANVGVINATPGEDDVERIINDLDNLPLGDENDVQSPRRMLQPVDHFVSPTTNSDFLNTTLTEDNVRKNNYDYDNDAANFSAASAPDDFDEEPIEQQNVDPIFNDSVYSIHTPGTSRLRPILRSKPSIPLHFNDTLGESNVFDKSVVKITAGLNRNKKKVRYVLPKPKLIYPESSSIEQPNLRRSRRTRVQRLRSDLGQVPIYEYDQDGGHTLVDVASVEIVNPRAQKYFTVDAEEQNKREKELKGRRKSMKEFAKKQRGRETGDY